MGHATRQPALSAQWGAAIPEVQTPAGTAAATASAAAAASAASEAVEQRLLGVAEYKGVHHGLQLAIVVKVAAVVHTLHSRPAGVGGDRVAASEIESELPCVPGIPCMQLLGNTAAAGSAPASSWQWLPT